MLEQSLIIVKPDGVVRGLTGQIVSRFERTGLKLVAAKMVQASEEMAHKHYPNDAAYRASLGQKTLDGYKSMGMDPIKMIGSDDAAVIGDMIRDWLKKYLCEGPVFVFVMEGPHAVEIVRQIVGPTMPVNAAPGTIRGDFSFDSPALANSQKRPVRNLIHASGNLEEAKHEVALWFAPDEIVSYKRVEEYTMML